MCGIAGLFRPAADRAAETLEAVGGCMTATLRHRGPDAGAVWVDAHAGIVLGHRRLAIIDLSPNGSQPMSSTSGRWVIAFNGEIYNFRALRDDLLTRGHRFRGHSDTEVLLAAIEQWGLTESLKRAVGMFALALWDREDHVLYLARDRMGEKPLYYGWVDGAFLFGSELKALRAYDGWEPTIDRDALALFLRHNYVPGPYTIYQGIRKLPPGTSLAIPASGDTAEPRPYWSLGDVIRTARARRFDGGEPEAIERLDRLLRQSIRGQMVADVPLGAFLSGGIDSSTVVALMQAQSERAIQTFTIGFHEQAYDEAVYAKAIAHHLGTDHTELYVAPADAIAVIPRLPTLYDEPFADSSQIPTFLVAQLARRSVTVSLSGDGGDELFGGYNRYFLARAIWQRMGRLPRPLRKTVARGITACAPTTWDRMFGAIRAALPGALRPRHFGDGLYKLAVILHADGPDEIYHRLVSHWEQPDRVVRGAVEPLTSLTNTAAWPELGDYTERMMYLDAITYLPDDILVKVDRACMAVSLEARVPLLDHRVIEFAWSLPLAFKVRNGDGKRLLRRVLNRYVPNELVDRPKMGFGVPIDHWLRGPLRDWAESLLDERRLRLEGFFDPGPIREKWLEHLSGANDWQYLLWDVLMFQAWREHNR